MCFYGNNNTIDTCILKKTFVNKYITEIMICMSQKCNNNLKDEIVYYILESYHIYYNNYLLNKWSKDSINCAHFK